MFGGGGRLGRTTLRQSPTGHIPMPDVAVGDGDQFDLMSELGPFRRRPADFEFGVVGMRPNTIIRSLRPAFGSAAWSEGEKTKTRATRPGEVRCHGSNERSFANSLPDNAKRNNSRSGSAGEKGTPRRRTRLYSFRGPATRGRAMGSCFGNSVLVPQAPAWERAALPALSAGCEAEIRGRWVTRQSLVTSMRVVTRPDLHSRGGNAHRPGAGQWTVVFAAPIFTSSCPATGPRQAADEQFLFPRGPRSDDHRTLHPGRRAGGC